MRSLAWTIGWSVGAGGVERAGATFKGAENAGLLVFGPERRRVMKDISIRDRKPNPSQGRNGHRDMRHFPVFCISQQSAIH